MKRSRYDYNWQPDPDDERPYRWNGSCWVVAWEEEEEMDIDAMEEFEEKRREKLAKDLEY